VNGAKEEGVWVEKEEIPNPYSRQNGVQVTMVAAMEGKLCGRCHKNGKSP